MSNNARHAGIDHSPAARTAIATYALRGLKTSAALEAAICPRMRETGQPCDVHVLLTSVAGSIARIRAEIAAEAA